MKKLLLFLLLLKLLQGGAFGQNRAIDSLQALLKKEQGACSEPCLQDTNYSNHLNRLSVEFKNIGNYDTAMHYANRALKVAQQINFQKGTSDAYCNIGVVHRSQGNYNKALEFFLAALKIYEEIQDKKGIAASYNYIGIVYKTQGNYNKALENYFAVLKIYQQIGARKGIAVSHNNIGNVYTRQGNYDKALENHFSSLKIKKEIGDKHGVANSYSNIGYVYTKHGKYDKALENSLTALEIYEEIGDLHGIAMSYNNIANLYLNQNKTAEAKKYSLTGLKLSLEIGSKDDIKEAYYSLSICDSVLGNWKDAYRYHLMYSEVKDSIFNQESSKQIAEIATKYETEKKEKHIAQQNLKLEQKELELNKKRIMGYALGGGILMLVLLIFVIYNRYRLKRKANAALESAYQIIEEKNKDINGSIAYARNIQQAILPDEKEIGNSLPDHFVFFQPKDVVSGDFYWFHDNGKKVFIIAADCTGHGVPGAFVSMVGNNLLNQVVIEKNISDPGHILTRLNTGVNIAFKREGNAAQANDGMDIAVCVVDKAKKQVEFAGAQNPLILIRGGDVLVTKADKTPIGGRTPMNYSFSTHQVKAGKGDAFYIFSDGYPDQFGGPKGKKFMMKRFKEMLAGIYDQPFDQQKQKIHRTFTSWIETEEQTDDVLVIGFGM